MVKKKRNSSFICTKKKEETQLLFIQSNIKTSVLCLIAQVIVQRCTDFSNEKSKILQNILHFAKTINRKANVDAKNRETFVETRERCAVTFNRKLNSDRADALSGAYTLGPTPVGVVADTFSRIVRTLIFGIMYSAARRYGFGAYGRSRRPRNNLTGCGRRSKRIIGCRDLLMHHV